MSWEDSAAGISAFKLAGLVRRFSTSRTESERISMAASLRRLRDEYQQRIDGNRVQIVLLELANQKREAYLAEMRESRKAADLERRAWEDRAIDANNDPKAQARYMRAAAKAEADHCLASWWIKERESAIRQTKAQIASLEAEVDDLSPACEPRVSIDGDTVPAGIDEVADHIEQNKAFFGPEPTVEGSARAAQLGAG